MGNIDLAKRPIVKNADGSYSTVRSMSFGGDNGEILVPTVSPSGQILTDQGAESLYAHTGQNLGVFDTPDHADMYAQALHKAQDQYYSAQSGQGKSMTLEQQRALAIAQAKMQAEQAAQPPVQVDPSTMQPPGVPEYQPPGVDGYDPQSGNVTMGAKGTFLTSGAEGVPILGGLLDKGVLNASAGLGSMISGEPFSQVKDQMQTLRDQSRESHPYAHMAGNMAGAAIATAPVAASATGAKLFGLAPGMSLPSRMAASGLTNGAISGADTAARGGSLRDVVGSTAIGAGVGTAMPPVADGASWLLGKAAGAFNRAAPAMTEDTLRAAKDSAYQAVDSSGVRYSPQAFNGLVQDMTNDVKSANISPMRHPKAASMIAEIQALKDSSPTLTQLDQLRQVVRRDVANSSDSAESFFGQKMIKAIDNFIAKAGPGEVVAGDAEQAAQAITHARDMNTRLSKLSTVNDLLDRAGLNAGSSGSGGNVENATRQQLKRLLTDPKLRRGLTPDEMAATERAVLGSNTQNALRLIGKVSPTSGGLSAMLGGAGSVAAPGVGIPAMVAGYGAKKTSEYLSRKSVGELVNLIAQGGDATTLPVVKNAVQLLAESKKQALAKALTVMGISGLETYSLSSPAKQ